MSGATKLMTTTCKVTTTHQILITGNIMGEIKVASDNLTLKRKVSMME